MFVELTGKLQSKPYRTIDIAYVFLFPLLTKGEQPALRAKESPYL